MKVTDGLDPKSHMLPLKLAFSLGKLKPGEYNCQVTVLDPTGQKASLLAGPGNDDPVVGRGFGPAAELRLGA